MRKYKNIIPDMKKQSILESYVFCLFSLLAAVIYYACVEVKNSACAEAIKYISGEYVKGFEVGDPVYFESSDVNCRNNI